ncbi:leucine-rich repeat domain-containing protein, partial [bacterium]|nr:leucine-rich repeat domain-containing protein [bacterium]
GCTSLETLNIPNTVTEIGSNAFYNVPKIVYNGNAEGAINAWGSANANNDTYTEVELDSETIERLTTLGIFETDELGRRTNVIIPSVFEYNGTKYKITKIKRQAFENATTLKSVVIPNSVTEIGMYAFMECTNLETAIIGNGVKELIFTFANCTSLKNVYIPNGVTKLVGIFGGCESLEEITIPDTVTTIGENSSTGLFYGCKSLISINIPNSVTTILGSVTFANCQSLTTITIPDSVTNYDTMYDFSGCTSLKNVVFGKGVKKLGHHSFNKLTSAPAQEYESCTALESVTIPNEVTEIGYNCFDGCTLLEATIPDSVTTIGYDAFKDVKHIYYTGNADDPENNHWGAVLFN